MHPGQAIRATFGGGAVACALFATLVAPAVADARGVSDKAANRPGTPIVTASLVADATAIAPEAAFTLAVRLAVPAGWHIYWINPGESGAPTNVDWRLPAGFTATPLAWPTPQRFVSESLVSYGYDGEVWLTARITPPAGLAAGSTTPVAAAVDWVVCAEVCVPEAATLTLSLPVGAKPRPAAADVARTFVDAAARLPQPAPGPVNASASGGTLVLSLEGLGAEGGPVTGASFFPTTYGQIDEAAAQPFMPLPGGARLTLTLPTTGAPLPGAIEGVLVVEQAQDRTGYTVHAPLRAS